MKRLVFQERFLAARKELLEEKVELEVQIANMQARIDNINRTLNGWDISLIQNYEV